MCLHHMAGKPVKVVEQLVKVCSFFMSVPGINLGLLGLWLRTVSH